MFAALRLPAIFVRVTLTPFVLRSTKNSVNGHGCPLPDARDDDQLVGDVAVEHERLFAADLVYSFFSRAFVSGGRMCG